MWEVVKNPKWHMHVFVLYALGSEEPRSLTSVGRVWRKPYSREMDGAVCRRMAAAQRREVVRKLEGGMC